MENNERYLLVDKKVQEYLEKNNLDYISDNLNQIIRNSVNFLKGELVIVSRTSKYIGTLTSIKINCIGTISNKDANIIIDHSKFIYNQDGHCVDDEQVINPIIIVDELDENIIVRYQLETIDLQIQLIEKHIEPKRESNNTYIKRP